MCEKFQDNIFRKTMFSKINVSVPILRGIFDDAEKVQNLLSSDTFDCPWVLVKKKNTLNL